MTLPRWTHAAALSFLLLAGCGQREAAEKPKEPVSEADRQAARQEKIEAARAKLSAEDRALVDAQDYCAVMTEQKLGGMGVPLKVMVKGQPVFVCCKGCASGAE